MRAVIFLALLLASCSSNYEDPTFDPFKKNHHNTDSTVSYVSKTGAQLEKFVVVQLVSKYLHSGMPDSAVLFLKKLRKEGLVAKLNLKPYVISAKAFFYFEINELDSASKYVGLIQPHKSDEPKLMLQNQTIKGVYFYSQRLTDSTFKYFSKGLHLAQELHDTTYISMFSINLGTISMDKGFYSTSVHYFLEAKKLAIHANSSVLANNIATCYVNVKAFEKAKKVIEDFYDHNEVKNVTQNDVLLNTTYAYVLCQLDECEKAKAVMEPITDSMTADYFKHFYLKVQFMLARKSASFSAARFYERHQATIENDPNGFFIALFDVVEVNKSEDREILRQLHFYDLKDRIEIEAWIPNKQSIYYTLMSYAEQEAGADEKSIALLHKALQAGRKSLEEDDSTKNQDLSLRLELMELEHRATETQQKLLVTEQKNKVKSVLVGSLGLVALVLVLITITTKENRKKALQKMEVEKQLSEEKNKSLETQMELNQRLISLSKIIIANSQKWVRVLHNKHLYEHPEIKELCREIESQSFTINSFKPKSLSIAVLDDYEEVFKNIPEWQQVNPTEKKIAIMYIEGYKPKDIANALALSVHYVRNVKLKLRKLLGVDKNFEFESLKTKS